jgi:glycosidase
MVGEVWDNHASVEKYYYEGLTSCFEFGYWPVLYRALTTGNASSYVSSVTGFLNDHKAVRSDAQTSFFMTNHDHSSQTGDGEVRAADDLGKDPAKEKQAAAMLLTSGGKPFIYQGEELGYWGNSKNRGDEYLRAPILWDKAGKVCAKKGVNNKVDNSMLTATISVEYQSAEKESLLNVYRTWSQLRNTYPALAEGEMSATSLNAGNSVASWYMTASNGQKLLVIHNCSGSFKTMSVSDDVSKPVGLLGEATISGKDLTLDAHSSVVFDLN